MSYLVHMLTVVAVYGILAISCNLLAGVAGRVPLSQAAFLGVGAYVAGWLSLAGWGFPLILLLALLAGAFVSLVISLPSVHLSAEYVTVASLGFQLVLTNVARNCVSVTNGPSGIAGIPHPRVFGYVVQSEAAVLGLAVGMLLVAFVLCELIVRSPLGRVLRAIREDAVLVEGTGRSVTSFLVVVYAVSSALAAGAGCLYAHFLGFIDPSLFTVDESLVVLAMVILGGAGSMLGSVLGAIVLVAVSELPRWFGLPSAYASEMRLIVFGLTIAGFVLFRPQGLVGACRLGSTRNGGA